MKKCPECDSEKIISGARLSGRGDGWSEPMIAVDEEPYAAIFKKTASSDVSVKVCGNCGFIGFYAIYPDKLWSAYQNRGK